MMPALVLAALHAVAPAQAQEVDQVSLNLEEFLQLYESARTRPKDPPPAQWAYAIESADFDGEVVMDGDTPTAALFHATVRVQAFADTPLVSIPLLDRDVGLQSATIAGRPASVITTDDGHLSLVTDRKDAFEVRLVFATPVTVSAGHASVGFALPGAASNTLRLAVPSRDDLVFEVANAQIQDDEVVGDQRVVRATLPSRGALMVTWQRDVGAEAAAPEARVYAEAYTVAGISDGLLSAQTTLQYNILYAGVDALSARIPDGATLLDVQGAGLRDWSLTGGVVTARLNYAAEGTYPLTLFMERVVGEGDVTATVPLPVPLGVERAKGWVGVESRGNLEISPGDVVGATPVDVRALPAQILGVTERPILLGYKYLGDAVTVPLVVSQHGDVDVLVTLLDQTRAQTMWTTDGRQLTSVHYQVRNNRKQYLRLSLPDGAQLWSAAVGGRAVQPARAEDGRVLVPLLRSQATGGALAAFDVEVVYVEDGSPVTGSRATFSADLPGADVPSTYVAWTVFVPADAKVSGRSFTGSLRHVEALSNPISSDDVVAIAAYRSQVERSAGTQAASGGLGQGAAPVPVSLPLQGRAVNFEKLLALDEGLTVSFDLRGLSAGD